MRLTVAVLLLLTVSVGLPAQEKVSKSRVLDPNRVIATVDDKMILMREVLKRVGTALGPNTPPAERAHLIDQQVLQLIKISMKIKGARKMGLRVDKAAIDAEYERRRKGLANRGEDLEKVMAEQGVSMAEYREVLREILLVEGYDYYTGGRAKPAFLPPAARPRHDSYVRPAELQAYYREHVAEFKQAPRARVRTIFVLAVDFLKPGMPMSSAKRKARMLARDVLKRIEGGEDFAMLAKEYSRDQWREQGGDRGFREKKELPDNLRTFAFRAAPGTVSRLLETTSGYVIARLEERQDARIRPFEEVQGEIRDRLAVRRQRRAISRTLLDLLDETDITPRRYAVLTRLDLKRGVAGR